MQTRVLFQKISQRMRVEFDQTAVAVKLLHFSGAHID
jgi:hypothetical protein